MSAKVLVVGGAGYIGSVTSAVLVGEGFDVVTFDDLSTGHAAAAAGTDGVTCDATAIEVVKANLVA